MDNSFDSPFAKLKGMKLPDADETQIPRSRAQTAKALVEKALADKKRPAKAKTGAPVPRKAPKIAPEESPAEAEDLFLAAMGGVSRLDEDEGGRRLPQPKPEAKVQPASQESVEDEQARTALMDLVTGKIEFELEDTGEYIQGRVRGLDSKILNQLKAGAISYEAHLDLHGLNAEQAYLALLAFLREHFFLNHKCLLLVTGKGRNSPGGQGVLREEITTWLTREPLKRVVLAFATARPNHGGTGALYVLLRNQKKTKGKVSFESLF